MAALGMTADAIVIERPVHQVISSTPIKAEAAGHIHYLKDEYAPVARGEEVFRISGLESFDVLQVGASPNDGIVGRRSHLGWPIAKPGEDVLTVLQVETVTAAGRHPAGCRV